MVSSSEEEYSDSSEASRKGAVDHASPAASVEASPCRREEVDDARPGVGGGATYGGRGAWVKIKSKIK